MYLLGLKVRIFNFALVLGLHPFLAWICCALTLRPLPSMRHIRQWELRVEPETQLKRENAKESFVRNTDIGGVNDRPNASHRLAWLTFCVVFVIFGLTFLASTVAEALSTMVLAPSSEHLAMLSFVLVVLMLLWLIRKAALFGRGHYRVTVFIGEIHRYLDKRPWDGLI